MLYIYLLHIHCLKKSKLTFELISVSFFLFLKKHVNICMPSLNHRSSFQTIGQICRRFKKCKLTMRNYFKRISQNYWRSCAVYVPTPYTQFEKV